MEHGTQFESGQVWCAVFHSEEYNWGLGGERWSVNISPEVPLDLYSSDLVNTIQRVFGQYFDLRYPLVRNSDGLTFLIGDGSVPPTEEVMIRFVRGLDLVHCLVLAGQQQ